ncbi:MAG: alpha/beta fold hydrolase [Chloroflexota bacterium]|nr:MAG: alpha/beta fold hydrolase [Chloroflexota bacterium]
MSITTIDGHLVHFEAYGRGRPILFVHGWLGSWRYWWPTMQALSNHHRSFAFDLWGYGDSSKDIGNYTLESYVGMLSSFADKLGVVRPFNIVGHSLGAAIALRYAKLEPESVERMALVTMPLSGDHVNGQLTGSPPSTLLDQAKSKFGAFPEVLMALKKTNAAALDGSASQFRKVNLADQLQELTCPTLLIFGARDTIVKRPETIFAKNCPSGSRRYCVSLDGCSHFPMLEQPAVFNRLLKEFLNHNGEDDLAPKNYWQRRTR